VKLKLLFILLISSASIFGWGKEGHSLINKKALLLLAAENPAFAGWESYLTEHASDPDYRRDQDSTEFPKHFIDIDYYPEFHSGKMITDKSELINKYGDSIVTAMGILPWATLESFDNLKKALAENNRDKALIFAVDLAHYIADAFNPMHTMLNYNGQLTGQNGIHSRYESNMVRNNIGFFETNTAADKLTAVENKLEFIFDYISRSNYLGPVLFEADKIAYQTTNTVTGKDYYAIMFSRTKFVTLLQMSGAAEAVASMIFAAWKEAESPPLENLN
jgi:hypothetical protein